MAVKKAQAQGASAVGDSKNILMLRSLLAKKMKLEPVKANYDPLPCVPTGSFVIDSLIGGTPSESGKGPVCPGFPRKKITEVWGNESSGKTTVCLAAAANVQRQGGSVLYLDFEHALHHGYAKAIGVNFDKDFALYAPTSLEDGFMAAYAGVKMGIDLIIIDSLAAMVPKDELEKGIDENAKVGAVAKKLAETLPKFALWLDTSIPAGSQGSALVLINQTRALISTAPSYGGEQSNTAGGKALKFYCSVRLQLTKIRSENIERTDKLSGKKKQFPFGNVVDCKIVKNKVNGTQGHKGSFFIRYGQGVDNVRSLVEAAVANNIVKRNGAQYLLGDQQYRGQEAFRKFLLDNEAARTELESKTIKAILDSTPVAIEDDEMDEEDEISAAMDADFGSSSDSPAAETVVLDDELCSTSKSATSNRSRPPRFRSRGSRSW